MAHPAPLGASDRGSLFQQVKTLFILTEVEVWGTFDPNTATASLHPQAKQGDEDLVDTAAAYTLRKGGTVYALGESEMPYHLPVAAIVRT